jgi:hypothetical protein
MCLCVHQTTCYGPIEGRAAGSHTTQVLQLPIVKGKLKKLLSSAAKKMSLSGGSVIPSSEDSLEQFLLAAGKLFGKDPSKWTQLGAYNGHFANRQADTLNTGQCLPGTAPELLLAEAVL